MLRYVRPSIAVLLALIVTGAPAALRGQSTRPSSEIVESSVSLSADEAVLGLETQDGRSVQIRLADGTVFINGDRAGGYTPGGQLESAWRDLLRAVTAGDIAGGWDEFSDARLSGDDRAAAQFIRDRLGPALSGAAAAAGSGAEVESGTAAAGEAVGAVTPANAPVAQEDAPREVVSGGLVIELTEVEDLARALGRVGLAPELSRVLNGDLPGPVRIVIDATEYRLPEGARLDNGLILVQSDGVIAGTVAGPVIVAEGSLRILPSARIEGDVVAVNASISNEGGAVAGALREARNIRRVVVPAAVERRVIYRGPSLIDNIWSGLGSLAKTIAIYLLFGFLGALVVYFFRGHLEAVSDTVSYSFGRSFVTGLAAEILFFPIMLVMTVLVLTIIAIPFYIVGFCLAILLGYLAVAHAAGENLTHHRFPTWGARMRRSNSYYYVLNGLGVLLAGFAGAAITRLFGPLLGWAQGLLIAAAWILTWVAATAGLGAALLSRGGTRRKYARPLEYPGLPVGTGLDERAAYGDRAGTRRRGREEL